MSNKVFISALVLALILGQGVAAFVRQYFKCVDLYGHSFCKKYFADRTQQLFAVPHK